MQSILSLELDTVAKQEGTPFDQACFVIALQVIAELGIRAEQLEKHAYDLAMSQSPDLVDRDGKPLSKPSGKKIQKKADETVPDILDSGEEPVA